MNKQKQIEEMANIVCKMAMKPKTCAECAGRKGGCFSIPHMEQLYNAGYRKIPENAVVLTGTETEERLEDLLIEFDEMSFFPATLMPNPEECAREWKGKLIYAIGQLRKETAEKFAERLKEELIEWLADNEDLNGKIDFGVANIDVIGVETLEGEVISEGLIDKVCKELTEGKANASKAKF